MTAAGLTGAANLIVSEAFQGARLDHFLREMLKLPRARLTELLQQGTVTVDGRPAKKGQRVLTGQRVALQSVPQGLEAQPDPEVQISLLHLDQDLVVIDKPAGLPSHPLRPGERGTIASGLVARFPECAGASEDPREGGLCHRLDIGTSGVLLAARNRDAWLGARQSFTQQQVDKRYWALVTGPLPDSGEIDLPLRHHPKHPERMEPSPSPNPGSRPAHSSFRVLSRAGEYVLAEVRIRTGVLHQVRAHLAAIGCPVVGDSLYGGRAEPDFGRFFLHARSLELPHPKSGSLLLVESTLPAPLQALLTSLLPNLQLE